MIERTFQSIREDNLSDADQQSFLVSLGWLKGSTWENLLRSKRVLMISEAGAAKRMSVVNRRNDCGMQGNRHFLLS